LPKSRRTTRTPAKATRRPLRAETRKQAGKKATRAKPRPQVNAPKAPGQPPPAALPVQASTAPTRKPGFYEAVAIYERGVQALQRHDFQGAAGFFRTVLDRYPDERELLERARLYLRVCERETERQQPVPKSPAERVYAATVALNSGDHNGALDHLQRALSEDPESDHAHYIMAVALGMRQRSDEAVDHLKQAIALNPENRSLARQDPDLESVREHPGFREALDTPPAPNRRRPAARRR
jgi:tetratricopeptide (TPR) repeat protein